ncbi:MAG TPA: methyltransferase domain-containing protein [Kofleriaceae bacterium]|nr:methyltransferase domain-containing protein [Kofleriaceae bacterium]
MSKRDDDGGADMEVGMTTAERRRRRRRGGGLRVPSDNVPRSRTPTAPPAPVPEDPALAMSIAYSFTNDASGPVPRTVHNDIPAPVAPDAMPTVIDPPTASDGEQDFEMKTREMTAVDLEALGLSADAPSSSMPRMSSPGVSMPRMERAGSVDVDVTVDAEPITAQRPAVEPAEPAEPKKMPGSRHKTVALSEEDLEEVRAATQSALEAQQAATAKPASRPADSNSTMPLSALDVEDLAKGTSEEPMSVPDIDIQELADRAESSGEIEVDVDTEDKVEEPAPAPAPPPRSSTPSVPPQNKPPAARTQAPPAPPAEAKAPDRKNAVIDAAHAPAAANTPAAAPPPPPPAAATKPPPAPPAAKKPLPQAAVAAVVAKEPSRPTSRARPWFVDLFDEDYLRTLPFLTPQATQSEAEYVINAMNLAPGAQVLDLGCGYGRHAMELAARGFHVVGLDLSTPLLVRGGEEAHRRGLTINFVRGDMRELDFENQFDGVYCLFSTFGYFDDETNKKTLQNVARALKPNGKVLVEILNRDYVIADLPTRVWWEGDGCVVLEEVELNYFSSRIQVNRSVVFDDGRQLEQEISVRAYSLHEVGKLMHAAGFRVLEVSGGYQTRGRFFGNQSRHIIVLAERKETSGT